MRPPSLAPALPGVFSRPEAPMETQPGDLPNPDDQPADADEVDGQDIPGDEGGEDDEEQDEDDD